MSQLYGFLKQIGLFFKLLFRYIGKFLFYSGRALNQGMRWIFYEINKGNRFFIFRLMWQRGKIGRPLGHLGIIVVTLMVLFMSSFMKSSNVFSDTNLASILKESEYKDSSDKDFLLNLAQATTNIPEDRSIDEIIEYTIQPGDTLSQIAESNHVTVDTIMAVNGIGFNDLLMPGQKLKILPVSGLEHTVDEGDNVESIAQEYKLDSPQPIIEINWLEKPYTLEVGQKLIIPGGVIPEPPKPVYDTGVPVASVAPSAPIEGTGQFLWPSPGYLSRGYGWYYGYFHGALDIANNGCGNPVYAADSGYVDTAGWRSGGWGITVWLNHGNGYFSKYAHLSSTVVAAGNNVSRGELIGYSGQTGLAYGCHLHFVVEKNGVAINPQGVL